MAHLDDILNAVEDIVKASLTTLPVQTPPFTVAVYQGMPTTKTLTEDMTNNVVNVSIIPNENSGKAIPLAINSQAFVEPVQVGVTIVKSGTQLSGGGVSTFAKATFTLAGTVNAGLNFMTIVGESSAPFHPTAGISLTTLAANICSSINSDSVLSLIITATNVGPIITLTSKVSGVASNAIPVDLRVGGTGKYLVMTGMIEDVVQIHVWAPNNQLRGLVANLVNDYLIDLNFLNMGEEQPARIMYLRRTQADREASLGVYRRTLYYTMQYSTTKAVEAYSVLRTGITLENTNTTSYD